MKQKSSSVYSDVQQDFIHRRLMKTISERIKKVDEIDKQNTQMTKRIQQQESSINFQKNALDYKKYSEFLRLSQKSRMVSHQRLRTVTCNGVSENDKKYNTFYSLKRTKTCEDLFGDENDPQEYGQNNQIIPRIFSNTEHVDPTQFLQLRPNTTALTKRPKKSLTDSQSLGIKCRQDNKIVLHSLEECQQRIYLDKLAEVIFLEKPIENTPKINDKKNQTSQVEKIFEKNREIQSSEFSFEIMKAMNQIIVRGKVNIEGGSKKKYFIKTFEKNYLMRILLRYMTEQQQLFLFDGVLQQDVTPFSEPLSETKQQSNIESQESIEEESITKQNLKNDILTKFINDIDIDNEKILIRSLNPQIEQKPQTLRSRSQDTKLNFHLKKNRNEIVKEETLQSYLAGKFRKLRTSLYNNLDNSIKKESSPSTNKAANSETQETTDEIKEEMPKPKLYTPSSFTNALLRKSQQSEFSNEDISKQNEEIDKSLNFFKNSKLSQYFNLYTEPDQVNEKQMEASLSKITATKLNSNFRNSVQSEKPSEKLVTDQTPARKKHYSYDFNGSTPIHTLQSQKQMKKFKLSKLSSSKTQLTQLESNQKDESNQKEETKNGINSQVLDSSRLESKEQTIQIKRSSSSSGSQKVKLFIMLQNKQKIKAKYYDQEEDKNEKTKMNSLLNKKNLSTQGQLLQNFLISKQQINKTQHENKQNIPSPLKTIQEQQQPLNNSVTIRNILSAKQKQKAN